MWIRLPLALALLVGIPGVVVVAQELGVEADAPPPAEPDLSSKAATHETVAAGTLPALEGRWMVLSDLELAGQRRTVPAFWEVQETSGAPVITEHFVTLPLELHNALEAKNEASATWEPTAAELATIAAAWHELPDQMRGVATVKNEIWAREAFTDEIKADAKTKDAQWVLRQTYEFVPAGRRPLRQVNIFGAREASDQGFTGMYSGVAVAAAPFPVPIPYNGSFRMIRLDPAPAQGWLERIADMFSGCGR